MRISHTLLSKIFILFWTFWWLIALWTDIVGGLAHLNFIHASWAPDTNYPFLVASLKMYTENSLLPAFAFVGIILWSAASAFSFLWASLALAKPSAVWLSRAKVAFIISLSYWLMFFLADQLVMKFDLEQNHMVQGGFQLLTFLTIFLLQDRAAKP